LSLLLAADVKGQITRVDIQALSKSRGRLGSRAFRLSRDATSALMRATQSMRWSGSNTLTCDHDRVPEVIELLRNTPNVRFSHRANQIITRDALLQLSLSTGADSSLRSEVSAVMDQIQLPVRPSADAANVHREGATFVRVPAVPQALREVIRAI